MFSNDSIYVLCSVIPLKLMVPAKQKIKVKSHLRILFHSWLLSYYIEVTNFLLTSPPPPQPWSGSQSAMFGNVRSQCVDMWSAGVQPGAISGPICAGRNQTPRDIKRCAASRETQSDAAQSACS